MTSLFILLGLIVLASALPKWHQLHDYDFDQYCRDFGKSYKNKHEYKLRKQIFTQNLQQHRLHNSDNTKTWKKGVNQYTDQSEDEISNTMGQFISPVAHKSFLHPRHYNDVQEQSFVGASVDWRSKGVITPVKDQGRYVIFDLFDFSRPLSPLSFIPFFQPIVVVVVLL
jgi:cathepsin L